FAVTTNGAVARLIPEWSETTPPVSTAVVSPAVPSSGWHAGPVDVTFTSADNAHGSGLKRLILEIDGITEELPDPLPGSVVRTFTTPGDHVIRFYGEDHAGNIEPIQTLHVRIDLAAPVVQAGMVNRVLTLSATDDASGIEWIKYRIDNGPELTYTSPVTLPVTAKVVRYQARDNAGRLSTLQSRVIGQFLKRVVFTPTTASAGSNVTVKVELLASAPPGGVVLDLVSSKPNVLAVPVTVAFPAGATSVSLTRTLGAVESDTSVQVTASFAGTQVTGGLVVRQSAPKSVSVQPSTVTGGESANGTVVLAGKAPAGGQVVELESLNPAVVQVPATVTVAAGAISASFAVASAVVESDSAV
ncbi:MAG: OmpL47-type beta-barrel domain-containing protein, partial [Armatimonadaceae bacterium]